MVIQDESTPATPSALSPKPILNESDELSPAEVSAEFFWESIYLAGKSTGQASTVHK